MMSYHEIESSSMFTSTEEMYSHEEEEIRLPGKHDILFGRGGAINQHVGNIMFRQIVNEQKLDYLKAPKSEKPQIAWRVVNIIRNLDPPGRFLAPIHESNRNKNFRENGSIVWHDVGDKKARAKASQCLREKKIDQVSDFSSINIRLQKSLGIMEKLPHNVFDTNDSFGFDYLNKDQSLSVSVDANDNLGQRRKPTCHQVDPEISGYLNSTKGYYNHITHYHENDELPSNRIPASSDSQALETLHLQPKAVQLVSPCQRGNGKQNNYAVESPGIHEMETTGAAKNLECDSWVRSFCSIESQMIDESESMSLSPPMQLRPIYQNHHNFPICSASWTSSDVRSELTDNSHTEDLE